MSIQFSSTAKDRLKLSTINTNGGTQSRAALSPTTASDYAEALSSGATFPPVVVFYDGSEYWLADGFHRYHAHLQTDRKDIAVDIRQGTRRDAILFSVGANDNHGLRRTNDDKHRSVRTLLDDPEWSNWSDREIAKRCSVGYTLVAKLRDDTARTGSMNRTFIHPKTGHPTQMNTSAIGKPVTDGEDFNNDLTDELTEEDIANDPGIQEAASQLNAAKALYDEAMAMPISEPMTPGRMAALQHAVGTQEERAIYGRVLRVAEMIDDLPTPEAMVDVVPPALEYTINPISILKVSDWFERFARAWEQSPKGKTA